MALIRRVFDDDARALRKPFVGVPAAAYRERQAVAAAPIDHDADSVRRLAQRAQLRRQHRACVERGLILRELRIAGMQQQGVGRRQVGQRWQLRPGGTSGKDSRGEDRGRGSLLQQMAARRSWHVTKPFQVANGTDNERTLGPPQAIVLHEINRLRSRGIGRRFGCGFGHRKHPVESAARLRANDSVARRAS